MCFTSSATTTATQDHPPPCTTVVVTSKHYTTPAFPGLKERDTPNLFGASERKHINPRDDFESKIGSCFYGHCSVSDCVCVDNSMLAPSLQTEENRYLWICGPPWRLSWGRRRRCVGFVADGCC
ncbi:hypothetical protein V5799_009385 [Amblyomma americanum]|uniref:Uncharacterized protein n=1 Tax=Amblyomma americanum TaxID=6943 RepID=A0AAQ4FB66_AMBAM